MHNLQQDFLTAFRAWDGFAMGEALIRIANVLVRRECSPDTKEHIVWSCRELLESMEGHPLLGYTIGVLEGPFALILTTGVGGTSSPGKLQHSNVSNKMRISREDSQFEQRWKELGFSSQTIEIPRNLVKSRIPLKDEPGYDMSLSGYPTIHKPTTTEPIPPNY